MFKGTNNGMTRTQENNSPDRLNRIVEGTTIKGDIRSDSNIRIDGTVTGTIFTKARLVVGPSGVIDGEVTCNDADLEGFVTGNLVVKELLSLKGTAKIEGTVKTGKMKVEAGALINAQVDMGGAASKGTSNVRSTEAPATVKPKTKVREAAVA